MIEEEKLFQEIEFRSPQPPSPTPKPPTENKPNSKETRFSTWVTLHFGICCYWANLSLSTVLDNDGAAMAGQSVVATNGHVKSQALNNS